jgi:glycosyltransferase involved in cell wall biosynthesis
MTIRLAHFVTHPIQYFAPLYRRLAAQPGVELTVLYGSNFGLQPSFDEGFGRTVRFDVPLLDGYQHTFLTNRGSGVPARGYRNFDCPDADAILGGNKFDVLWVHGWAHKAHWQFIRAARRQGVPYLIRGETSLLLKPKYTLRWFFSALQVSRMVRAAAACLYIGRGNHEFYASLGVPESRLRPARYSVDAAAFRDAAGSEAERAACRRQFGAEPDVLVVACAAKAIPRKRLEDAIRAVGKLGPAVRLWILGDGPLRPRLEELAAREAPGRVVWHGFVNQSQMPRLLAAADVFAMPSEEEPWGLAINEAMAVGLPVVCSHAVGCAADLVRHGETGYQFRVGDIAAFVQCLDKVRCDPAARRRMGRAAQALVINEYDAGATARQIAGAVRELVPARPASVAPRESHAVGSGVER